MKTLPLILSLLMIPTAALAQDRGPGSGTDLYRVQRDFEAMVRDGRYERLLREGQANKEAFDRLRQRDLDVSTTASVPRRR